MTDVIQNKKDDLQKRSDQLVASIQEEYFGFFKESISVSKISIAAAGVLIAVSFMNNLSKPKLDSAGPGGDVKSPAISKFLPGGLDLRIKNEFRDKVIIIALEILRRLLLTVISKLNPPNEKKDIF